MDEIDRVHGLRTDAQGMVIEEQMLQNFSPEERAQLKDFLERACRNVGGRLV